MVECLEPCFAVIEPHAYVLCIDLLELLLVVRGSWSATEGRGSRLFAWVSHGVSP